MIRGRIKINFQIQRVKYLFLEEIFEICSNVRFGLIVMCSRR